jgi:hypothetical protein
VNKETLSGSALSGPARFRPATSVILKAGPWTGRTGRWWQLVREPAKVYGLREGGWVGLSQANLVTLIVGFSAALVALIGYLLSQSSDRRNAKANSYALALEAVKEFEELPYRIARRPASDGQTRADLGDKMSDAYVKLELYRAWTAIDSPLAGEAYSLLVSRDHKEVRPHIVQAWKFPVMSTDEHAPLNSHFDCDNAPEWDCCIRVMRRELSLFAPLLRPGTRRFVHEFALSAKRD